MLRALPLGVAGGVDTSRQLGCHKAADMWRPFSTGRRTHVAQKGLVPKEEWVSAR